MQIYLFSKDGFFLGPERGVKTARPDPKRAGRFLIPENATALAPPAPEENQAPRWNGAAWELAPDYSGQVFYAPDGSTRRIVSPGDDPPEGWPTTAPPAAFLGVSAAWDGQSWAHDLAACRAAAQARVDALAEAERLKVLTPGAGQQQAYLCKEAEARALGGDASPDPANYPFLAAEVGITARLSDGRACANIGEVASVVLILAAAWKPFGAGVEGVRLAAKRDIEAAENLPAMRAIIDGLAWPALPIGA